VTDIILVAIVNLVTPKVGAKHELLFNKPASPASNSHSISATVSPQGLSVFVFTTFVLTEN